MTHYDVSSGGGVKHYPATHLRDRTVTYSVWELNCFACNTSINQRGPNGTLGRFKYSSYNLAARAQEKLGDLFLSSITRKFTTNKNSCKFLCLMHPRALITEMNVASSRSLDSDFESVPWHHFDLFQAAVVLLTSMGKLVSVCFEQPSLALGMQISNRISVTNHKYI